MALTWTIPDEVVTQVGYVTTRGGVVSLDGAYVNNGYPVAAMAVGFHDTIYMIAFGKAAGYVLQWDTANQKLLVYCNSGSAGPLAQASGSLATVTGVPFVAYGR